MAALLPAALAASTPASAPVPLALADAAAPSSPAVPAAITPAAPLDLHSGVVQPDAQPSSETVVGNRHIALEALTVATRAFVAAARHARARGPWTADDTMDTRRALKRAGRLRRARVATAGDGQEPPSVRAMWRCVQHLDEQAERWRARRTTAMTPAPTSCDQATHVGVADPVVPNDTAPNDSVERRRPAGDMPDEARDEARDQARPLPTKADSKGGQVTMADTGTSLVLHDAQRSAEPSAEATITAPTISETSPSRAETMSLADIEVDSLTRAELDVFVARHRFVTLVEGGMAVMEAVEKAQLPGQRDPETEAPRLLSERGARELLRRYRKHGPAALLDRRRRSVLDGRNPRRVWTPKVQEVVLRVWTTGRKEDDNEGLPATAPITAVARVARQECPADAPKPSDSTVRRIIAAEPYAVQLFRSGQEERWKKTGHSVVRTDLGATRGNERGQFDHSPTNTWIRIDTKDHRDGALAVPTWSSAALDAYSRTVMSLIIEDADPTAWTTALLLRKAILPKSNPRWLNRGVPFIYQPDRGSTLVANSLQISLAKLHATFDPDPPYYPNRKGKVERFFQTLDENCLMILPGHKSRGMVSQEAAQKHVHQFLNLSELRAEAERWIVDDYHQWPHPTIRGSTREQVWVDTAVIRMPDESEHDGLDVLLLKHDKQRTVQNVGIEFTFPEGRGLGGIYWAEELEDWKKRQVTLAYNPEDDASVLVYEPLTGHFICEAWKDPDPEAVKTSRRNYEAGVRERLASYADAREAVPQLPQLPAPSEPVADAENEADTGLGGERGRECPHGAASTDADADAPSTPRVQGAIGPARPQLVVANSAAGVDPGGVDQPLAGMQRTRAQTKHVPAATSRRANVDPPQGDDQTDKVIDLVERYRRITRGGA